MVREKYNIHYTTALALTAIAAISTSFITPQAFADTEITVTAEEMLTVQVTTPTVTPTGTPTADGTFLLNTVGLTVATNNANGFSASMTTETTNTALKNESDSSVTIPVLTASTSKSSFPANYWGFSTDDSTYTSIAPYGSSTPTYVASSAASDTAVSRNLYFGAKANTSQASGTYSNTVIISVVSGVNTNNPTTPDNPITPGSDSDPTDTNPTYVEPTSGNTTPGGSATGATVYTRTSSTSNTTTTGTTVTTGNTVGSTYVSPAGVVSTTAAIVDEGTPLATGLAVTAGVAATAGAIFFIIAKRRRDDEDEEDY